MLVLSHEEIRSQIKNAPELIVEDMLQADTVNVLIGDSGLGKSPLLMQLGICVAMGIPFLGLKTRHMKVLYIDYENSKIDLGETLDNLSTFLGQPIPEDFGVLHFPATHVEIEKACQEFRPGLILIDALRGYDPKAEKEPDLMVAMLTKLHRTAVDQHCTFVLLHHIRKPDQKTPPKLLSDMSGSLIEWTQQAAGTRALINQTEARFGVEGYTTGDASLIMRGHFKLRGEVGPWKIRRVFGEEEKALGYERIVGIELLSQIDRDRFIKLPESFTWGEAEILLGMKAGKNLSRFLNACRAAGLLYRTGSKKDAKYHKTAAGRAVIII